MSIALGSKARQSEASTARHDRVQTCHSGMRCRSIQLFRVQAIVTQSTAMASSDNGELTAVSSVRSAVIKPLARQGFHCICDGIEAFTVLAGGLTQCGRYQRGSFGCGSGRCVRHQRVFCVYQSQRPPSACAAEAARHMPSSAQGSVVDRTAFTMPRVTCRAGDINQSFSQAAFIGLCLQPVNLWRRLSQP